MKEGWRQPLKLGCSSLIFNFPLCWFFSFFNQRAHYLLAMFKGGFAAEILVLNPRGRRRGRLALEPSGLHHPVQQQRPATADRGRSKGEKLGSAPSG